MVSLVTTMTDKKWSRNIGFVEWDKGDHWLLKAIFMLHMKADKDEQQYNCHLHEDLNEGQRTK